MTATAMRAASKKPIPMYMIGSIISEKPPTQPFGSKVSSPVRSLVLAGSPQKVNNQDIECARTPYQTCADENGEQCFDKPGRKI
jgi:hypothetical protein